MTYFRRYYEAPDDSGAAVEDAPAPDAPDVATEAPETPAAEPFAFTPELLAEHLPQFQERFLAHHDPAEALRLYGERDRNVQAALTRYTQGAPTDADVETLRESGYEIPDQEVTPEPMWDAPWDPMNDWTRVEAHANSEVPQHRQMAVEAVWDHPGVPQEYKDWAIAKWAEIDGFGAQRFYADRQAQTQADQFKAMLEEQNAAHQQELSPLQQRAEEAEAEKLSAKIDLLVTKAAGEIPEFNDHRDALAPIIERYAQHFGGIDYFRQLVALPPDEQMRHMREVVGAAMMAGRPAAMAEAEAERQAQEAAKAGAAGQRGRGANGSGSAPQSELKRSHMESIERAVKARTGV